MRDQGRIEETSVLHLAIIRNPPINKSTPNPIPTLKLGNELLTNKKYHNYHREYKHERIALVETKPKSMR